MSFFALDGEKDVCRAFAADVKQGKDIG